MIRADYTLAAIALASVANCYLRWLTLGELRTGALYIFSLLLCTTFYRISPLHPLAAFPGPVQCRLSSVWLTYVSYCGQRYLVLDRLHAKYGPFVRIGEPLCSKPPGRRVT